MTSDTLNAVAQAVGRAVIDRLFDRCILDPSTGCLLWTGYTTELGYGQIRLGSKVVLVHRLMWELTNYQPIPHGCVVLHTCDNPPCCEPMHLELGTHEDNVEDRVHKGRSARGERHGRAKLTADDAAAIRRRRAECTESLASLAREFGVHPRAIAKVLSGETWNDVKTA